jgi:hypothetical protein
MTAPFIGNDGRLSSLDGNLVQRDDELDAIHLFSMKTLVICDEEIDLRAGGAGELNGVGCPH